MGKNPHHMVTHGNTIQKISKVFTELFTDLVFRKPFSSSQSLSCLLRTKLY